MRRRTLIGALGAAALVSAVPGAGRAGYDVGTALEPRTIGSTSARLVLIEYFSLTCSHCARFHTETWPKLRDTYVVPGHLQVELRDFPLDLLALRAAALARCLPKQRYAPMIDLLLKQQASWATSGEGEAALVRLARLAGMDEETARACMNDRDLLEGIGKMQRAAQAEHGVDATPTFVLNGERLAAFTFEEFDAVLSDALR